MWSKVGLGGTEMKYLHCGDCAREIGGGGDMKQNIKTGVAVFGIIIAQILMFIIPIAVGMITNNFFFSIVSMGFSIPFGTISFNKLFSWATK